MPGYASLNKVLYEKMQKNLQSKQVESFSDWLDKNKALFTEPFSGNAESIFDEVKNIQEQTSSEEQTSSVAQLAESVRSLENSDLRTIVLQLVIIISLERGKDQSALIDNMSAWARSGLFNDDASRDCLRLISERTSITDIALAAGRYEVLNGKKIGFFNIIWRTLVPDDTLRAALEGLQNDEECSLTVFLTRLQQAKIEDLVNDSAKGHSSQNSKVEDLVKAFILQVIFSRHKVGAPLSRLLCELATHGIVTVAGNTLDITDKVLQQCCGTADDADAFAMSILNIVTDELTRLSSGKISADNKLGIVNAVLGLITILPIDVLNRFKSKQMRLVEKLFLKPIMDICSKAPRGNEENKGLFSSASNFLISFLKVINSEFSHPCLKKYVSSLQSLEKVDSDFSDEVDSVLRSVQELVALLEGMPTNEQQKATLTKIKKGFLKLVLEHGTQATDNEKSLRALMSATGYLLSDQEFCSTEENKDSVRNLALFGHRLFLNYKRQQIHSDPMHQDALEKFYLSDDPEYFKELLRYADTAEVGDDHETFSSAIAFFKNKISEVDKIFSGQSRDLKQRCSEKINEIRKQIADRLRKKIFESIKQDQYFDPEYEAIESDNSDNSFISFISSDQSVQKELEELSGNSQEAKDSLPYHRLVTVLEGVFSKTSQNRTVEEWKGIFTKVKWIKKSWYKEQVPEFWNDLLDNFLRKELADYNGSLSRGQHAFSKQDMDYLSDGIKKDIVAVFSSKNDDTRKAEVFGLLSKVHEAAQQNIFENLKQTAEKLLETFGTALSSISKDMTESLALYEKFTAEYKKITTKLKALENGNTVPLPEGLQKEYDAFIVSALQSKLEVFFNEAEKLKKMTFKYPEQMAKKNRNKADFIVYLEKFVGAMKNLKNAQDFKGINGFIIEKVMVLMAKMGDHCISEFERLAEYVRSRIEKQEDADDLYLPKAERLSESETVEYDKDKCLEGIIYDRVNTNTTVKEMEYLEKAKNSIIKAFGKNLPTKFLEKLETYLGAILKGLVARQNMQVNYLLCGDDLLGSGLSLLELSKLIRPLREKLPSSGAWSMFSSPEDKLRNKLGGLQERAVNNNYGTGIGPLSKTPLEDLLLREASQLHDGAIKQSLYFTSWQKSVEPQNLEVHTVTPN